MKTGRGSQKAYLAEVSPELYSHVVDAAGGDPQGWDASRPVHLQAIDQREVVDDALEAAVKSDTALETTEKEALVKSRSGQGLFRERVEDLEGPCRVTGLSEPALLIAGHIKPWRSCESAAERLDGHNGFLLAPHIDRLFDRGFISFDDDGEVIVSTMLAASVIECLQLSAHLKKNVGPFSEQTKKYLAFHRANVFLSEPQVKPAETK